MFEARECVPIPPFTTQPVVLLVPHDTQDTSSVYCAYEYLRKNSDNVSYTFLIIGSSTHDIIPDTQVPVFTEKYVRSCTTPCEVDTDVAHRLNNKLTQSLYGCSRPYDVFFYSDSEQTVFEKSIQTQLTYIHYFFPEAKIVPVLLNTPGFCAHLLASILVHMLQENKKNHRFIVILSTNVRSPQTPGVGSLLQVTGTYVQTHDVQPFMDVLSILKTIPCTEHMLSRNMFDCILYTESDPNTFVLKEDTTSSSIPMSNERSSSTEYSIDDEPESTRGSTRGSTRERSERITKKRPLGRTRRESTTMF